MNIETIEAFREEGKTLREIAKHYSCRAKEISKFMKENGIGPTPRVRITWSEENLIMLRSMRNGGKTCEVIAKEFGCSSSAIDAKLKNLGLTKSKKIVKFTIEELSTIATRIKNGELQEDIATSFGTTAKTLRIKLKEARVPTKKYVVKHRYFEFIDNEERAYFLGLMYADGYNNLASNQIKLKLLTEDKYIIEKLASALTEGDTIPPVNVEKGTNCSTLQVYSKKLCSDLAKHGCGKAKAFDLQFPTFINPELYRHFIRGYFDGDGSVFTQVRGMNLNKFTSVNFTGYISFIDALQDHLVDSISVSKVVLAKMSEKGTVQITYSSYKDIEAIRDYFYKGSDSKLRLLRKYIKFPTDKDLAERKLLGQEAKRRSFPIKIVNILTKTEHSFDNFHEASEKLGVSYSTLKTGFYGGHTVAKKYKITSSGS